MCEGGSHSRLMSGNPPAGGILPRGWFQKSPRSLRLTPGTVAQAPGAPGQGWGLPGILPGGLTLALGLWDQGLQEDGAWLCMRDDVHAGLRWLPLRQAGTFVPFCTGESLLVTSSSYRHGPSGVGLMIRIPGPCNWLHPTVLWCALPRRCLGPATPECPPRRDHRARAGSSGVYSCYLKSWQVQY